MRHKVRVAWLLLALTTLFLFVRKSYVSTDFVKHVVRYSDRYCVVYNFKKAEGLNDVNSLNYTPITLAIHSTLHYSRYIEKQLATFEDFISYAVLVEHTTIDSLKNLSSYWECSTAARRKLSIHIVYEKGLFMDECASLPVIKDSTCETFNRSQALVQWSPPISLYPINVMRNVARKGAGTGLHIVADSENIFSAKFCHMVRNETLKMMNSKTKRFEIANKIQIPGDIIQLYRLLKSGKAQMFHKKFFGRGHFIPDSRKWMTYSRTKKEITSWPVSYWSKSWEPQFIMPADAPYHYEDVPTRAYDHQVLLWELCRAGYAFRVLSHVFNTHQGIKTNMTDLEMAIRKVGKSKWKAAERRINDYLDRAYPTTKDNCPKRY